MKILFFDGYCNLCNGLVEWLVRTDQKGKIKIASLQGESAKQLPTHFMLSSERDPDTAVYLREGKLYERSSAILMVLFDLGDAWKIAKLFLLIPTLIRDGIYKMIAKNRYRIFGRRNSCRLPSPEERERFLP